MTFWDAFFDRLLNSFGGAFVGVVLAAISWLTPWATAPSEFSLAAALLALAGAIVGSARPLKHSRPPARWPAQAQTSGHRPTSGIDAQHHRGDVAVALMATVAGFRPPGP